ncbi:MAG: hypothetical protein WD226_05645 [Planctomycetota bacterium]
MDLLPWRLTVVLLGWLAGCNAFPIQMYVDATVIEELERTRYASTVRDSEIAGRMNVFLDYDGGPWEGEGDDQRYHRVDGPVDGITPAEFEAIGTAWTRDLADGDLLLAKNLGAQSLATTLTFEDLELYDHVGVLVRHRGRWHVAESWPRVRFLGSAIDFASRFEGRVERRPLGEFLARYRTLQVIRVGTLEQREALARAAVASLSEGLVFDPYHDPNDEDVSCSEYVALLFERVGLPTPARADVSDNPSLQRAMDALGFRLPSYLTPDGFARLPGAVHVGWISRFEAWEHLWIQEECVRMLHERFLDGGSLGDYLEPAPLTLMRYRSTTRAFFRWAQGYFRTRPTRDVARVRRVLARLYDTCFEPKGIRP